MRFIAFAIMAVAALLSLPLAGASCHYCFLPEPIQEILRPALP